MSWKVQNDNADWMAPQSCSGARANKKGGPPKRAAPFLLKLPYQLTFTLTTHFLLSSRAIPLEHELQLKLHQPWRRVRTKYRSEDGRWRRHGVDDLAEPRIGSVRHRRFEVRVVKDVKELRSQDHLCALGNLGVLHQREIRVPVIRTPESVPANVAEGALRTCGVEVAGIQAN